MNAAAMADLIVRHFGGRSRNAPVARVVRTQAGSGSHD
jgi:hypothetical protein